MPDCKPDNDPCDVMPLAGEAWSICLPFGGRIWADDNGVHAKGGVAPPDGVYGKIIIANGCLVGVEPEDVPLYTGSPCSPLPCGCGGSGENRSSVLGNGFTPGNTVVTCEIEAGSGVTVTGSGTDADPYVISAENGIYLRSANAAIGVTGSGTKQNPFTLKHKEGLATTINGMTFDAFGHLTSANTGDTAGTKSIKGIVPGFGIAVSVDNSVGTATVSQQLQPASVPGDYQLGGFDVTLDKAGQVSAIKRAINIDGAPFTASCGSIDMTVNQFGAITGIVDMMNLGTGYVVSWDDDIVGNRSMLSAQFTLRHATGLAGISFHDNTEIKEIAVRIDDKNCQHIGFLFWGNGLYLPGQHTLTLVGPYPGKVAALLLAANGMDRVW